MNPSRKATAAIVLMESGRRLIYTPRVVERIAASCTILDAHISGEDFVNHGEILSDIEILFSGWGGPRLDAQALALVPNLRAVFYGAGSIKGTVSPAFWERQLPISSAWGVNATSVAEYTFAQIILSLKQAYQHTNATRTARTFSLQEGLGPMGSYGATIGLISLGQIGAQVADMLKLLDVNVLAHDPYADEITARERGIALVDLPTLFARSHVVSLHTPSLPETRGMITGELLDLMAPGTTFINTARGDVVDEPALIEILKRRPDLFAVLDVTFPEPPPPDSPLYDMANVVITPHIAGAVGRDAARLGMAMAEECERFLAGEPLKWALSRSQLSIMA